MLLHRLSSKTPGTPGERSTPVCRALRAPAAPRRYLTLPNIIYSNAIEDINLLQLQQLYTKVNRHRSLATGSPTQRSFFHHWDKLSDEEAQQKLQLLLQRSVGVVAAFVRDRNLYSIDDLDDDDYDDAASTSSSSSSSSATGLLWGPFAWRQRLPRRLVGFVRASGDHALVATVHDLIIHPDLQGFGLGSTLLRRLVAKIADEGVYDVGTVTPANLQPFFHSCSFDLDRENSIPMALGATWRAGSAEQINQPLQANTKLARLLQEVTLKPPA